MSLVFLAPFLLHTWFCLHPHFLGCAFHGIQVLWRMLGAYCRMCTVFHASHSAFTLHRVWMTFADPVRVKLSQLQRLTWVLIIHPSQPEQEMESEPCNHTCPAYEVPVSLLRRGIWPCVGVARLLQYRVERVRLNRFTIQLHRVLVEGPSSEGSCLTKLLCCFAPFCHLFSNSLRMQD